MRDTKVLGDERTLGTLASTRSSEHQHAQGQLLEQGMNALPIPYPAVRNRQTTRPAPNGTLSSGQHDDRRVRAPQGRTRRLRTLPRHPHASTSTPACAARCCAPPSPASPPRADLQQPERPHRRSRSHPLARRGRRPCRRRAHGSGPRPGDRSPRGFGFTARLVTAHAHPGRAGAFQGTGEPESVTGEEL
jgi:hypothetical protein